MPLKFSIIIPLTKGQFAKVDSVDADLVTHKWCVNNHISCIYAARWFKGKNQYMHRVIVGRILGRELKQSEHVDHKNGNGLDNRRANLRLATVGQNMANRLKQKNNTSGYKGVCWHKSNQKWIAKITTNGKIIHLGYYDTPELAYEAYKQAALKYHGEYAKFE